MTTVYKHLKRMGREMKENKLSEDHYIVK